MNNDGLWPGRDGSDKLGLGSKIVASSVSQKLSWCFFSSCPRYLSSQSSSHSGHKRVFLKLVGSSWFLKQPREVNSAFQQQDKER